MENSKKNHFLFTSKSFLIISKLTKNLVFVLFLLSLILFSFYLIGNFQNYLDKSLILILNVLSTTSTITVFLSFFGILECIISILIKNKTIKTLILIILYIIIIGLSILLIAYSTILKEIAMGIK